MKTARLLWQFKGGSIELREIDVWLDPFDWRMGVRLEQRQLSGSYGHVIVAINPLPMLAIQIKLWTR